MRTPTLLHRSFRLSMIANTLPRSCKALGPRALRELTHAWWAEGPPRSMQFVKRRSASGEGRALLAADGSRPVGELCAELGLPGRIFAELLAAGRLSLP